MNSIILFKARLVSNFVYDSDRNKNTLKERKEEIGINLYNSIQPQGFPRTEWVTAAAPNPPRKPRRPLPTGLLFPRKNLVFVPWFPPLVPPRLPPLHGFNTWLAKY